MQMSLDQERRELVLSALPIAESVARSHAAKFRQSDRDDILGNAYEGLVLAADRFDVSRGLEFERYARSIVRNHVLNCQFRQYSAPGEKPLAVAYAATAIRDAEPGISEAEIAKRVGVPVARLRANRAAAYAYSSYEGTLRDRVRAHDGPSIERGRDRVLDPLDLAPSNEPDPADAAVENERRRAVLGVFCDLDLIDRKAVSYGLFGKQAKLAGEIGVSKQRISQRYRASLAKMRPALERVVA